MGEPKEEDKDKKPEEENAEGIKQFENLDPKTFQCFGVQHPRESSWMSLVQKSRESGWKSVDAKVLERSLSKDVNESYLHLTSFHLVNLDDDVHYFLQFDNQNYLWRAEIEDSPLAEIQMDVMKELMESELVKKLASRSAQILESAMREIDEVVDSHLRAGELLSVDETKLEAVKYILHQKVTLENLRSCKWMKQD